MHYWSTNKTAYTANHLCCPKYRSRESVSGVDARLKATVAEFSAEVTEIEGLPDHAHLLAEFRPTLPLSEFPRLHRLPVLWSPSGCVSRAGGAPRAVVGRWGEERRG